MPKLAPEITTKEFNSLLHRGWLESVDRADVDRSIVTQPFNFGRYIRWRVLGEVDYKPHTASILLDRGNPSSTSSAAKARPT